MTNWTAPIAFNNGDPLTLALANALMVDNPQFLYEKLGLLDAKLGYTLLTGDANFSFPSIPQDYENLIILGLLRTNRTNSTSDAVTIRFNNDSGNNYNYQRNRMIHNTNTGVGSDAQSSITIPVMSSSGSVDANRFSPFRMTLHRYSNGAVLKSGEWSCGRSTGTANTDEEMEDGRFTYMQQTAISRIDLTASTGTGFVAGSVIAIFGTHFIS